MVCWRLLISGFQSQTNFDALRDPYWKMRCARARKLRPRERDVIELVSQGFGSAAISTLLQVTLETVKTHRKRAYRKLHISSQAELFALMLPKPTAIKYHA